MVTLNSFIHNYSTGKFKKLGITVAMCYCVRKLVPKKESDQPTEDFKYHSKIYIKFDNGSYFTFLRCEFHILRSLNNEILLKYKGSLSIFCKY